jgi:nucleoside-diphosphate-sugar epimerase
LPFDEPPAYAPVDEDHPPRPETSYAMSKLVGETLAEQFARRTGIPFIGLRISNIMEPSDYDRFASWQHDARIRRWNLWGYVDARDVAQAVARGLEADVRGAVIAIIAAADTCMRRPSADLMAEVYPGVEVRGRIDGRETLLSIARARSALGYTPAYSWTDDASRTT